MTQQIDVRAIITHIICGDGRTKCRICMRDTKDGLVLLEDTVMMDGEKAVTLSEVLEIVTGIEVESDDTLPAGLCSSCTRTALSAANFRLSCQRAARQWKATIETLNSVPSNKNIAAAIVYNKDVILIDRSKRPNNIFQIRSACDKSIAPRTFKCTECHKEFLHPFMLFYHLKESHKIQACYICGDLMLRGDLVLHTAGTHNSIIFDCKKCPSLLLSEKQFKEHSKHAHSVNRHGLESCQCEFKGTSHIHCSIHQQKKCSNCSTEFINEPCLRYHVEICHKLNKTVTTEANISYNVAVNNPVTVNNIASKKRTRSNGSCICDYCGKSFAGKKFVSAHIQIVHLKNTHRPCSYCGKLLAAAHMTEHVKRHLSVQTYTCDDCGIVLKTKLGYVQHRRLHTGEKPYTCKHCGESFSASSRRSEHVRQKHNPKRILLNHACILCPARFRLPYRLQKHLQNVHKNTSAPKKLFNCGECQEKFESRRGLLHHIRRKHQLLNIWNKSSSMEWDRELPAVLCVACAAAAASAYHFRNLCLTSHSTWRTILYKLTNASVVPDQKKIYLYLDERFLEESNMEVAEEKSSSEECHNKIRKSNGIKCPGLECPDCGKKFDATGHLDKHLRGSTRRACYRCARIVPRDGLADHLRGVHDVRVYECARCHRLFDEPAQLSRHTAEFHLLEDCQCKVCGQGFRCERSLRAHEYAHTLFGCASCDKTFENRKCFLFHQLECEQKVSPKTYECHDCGAVYSRKPSLKMHMVLKHSVVPSYVCQVCGKRSATLAHHKTHEAVHEERKIYSCHCGATVGTALGFKMHQRIHSGEKPYECRECGERFLSASRRSDHVKRRHWTSKEMAHKCTQCGATFLRPFELKKRGVCATCTELATGAYRFRSLVRRSQRAWENCIESLLALPDASPTRAIYALLKDNLSLQSIINFEGDSRAFVDNLARGGGREAERKQRQRRNGPTSLCVDCGKTFPSPYYLGVHLRNSGQKEACALCGAMTLRGREMRDHLAVLHETDAFLCGDCPMLFHTEAELATHRRRDHGPGALTCPDCGRTFQRKASFEVHAQMHAVRTCRACGAQFANRSCYREHRARCEPDAKPDPRTIPRNRRCNVRDPATFTCDYCGKTYRSRHQLKNHILWIHMDVRPHQCQWCSKRFYTPARLAEHSVVHTRVRNFECDICGAKLVSKMAAVYHRRRHTGERPYECADCGERFISSSRRSEHAKRRHNRGARLPCHDCPATFVRTHELRKHVEKAHGADPAQTNKLKELNLYNVEFVK
ncbi:zinc finger protein 594-like [Aricia agestis]|uniref:zinc finger protein 594-like n=1 Tax=Aricia agestis TaxID=91739 RepID=UPI001C20A50D|nr:zinc finger protein 594-like [Aricia agestis]